MRVATPCAAGGSAHIPSPTCNSRFVVQCRRAYEFSIANFLHDQAIFFAERLSAEVPSDETVYLLAAAHFHAGDTNQAYIQLREHQLTLPRARYLLALCCFRLNKLEEAETALLSSGGESQSQRFCESGTSEVVNGAAGLFLLGQIKERQRLREKAVQSYRQSLELCPFMWCAFDRLSSIVHGMPKAGAVLAHHHFDDSLFSKDPVLSSGPSPDEGSNVDWMLTRKRSRPDGAGGFHEMEGDAFGDRCSPASSGRTPNRSSRTSTTGVTMGLASLAVSSPQPSKEDEVTLAALLCILGTAVHLLHGFRCQQALHFLQRLPRRHYQAGYVQDVVARCQLESAEYQEAADVFARNVETFAVGRVQGLEYYSTVLWHLKKEMELSHLARRALEWDRLKPQVWCVLGNCFSMQREHDRAIRCFRRACQIDQFFTYAYTLCAHEYCSTESFDKAIELYEHAISLDSRHYNAWWGLGNIYFRREEHQNARYHFRRALDINSDNAVLRISLGMVCQALNEPKEALELFTEAAKHKQCRALALYHKGVILAALGGNEEALTELKPAQSLAPREPCIHFQLGKAYAQVGDTKKALVHLTNAMDLCGAKDLKDHQILISAQTELQRSMKAAPSPMEESPPPPSIPPGRSWDREDPPQIEEWPWRDPARTAAGSGISSHDPGASRSRGQFGH